MSINSLDLQFLQFFTFFHFLEFFLVLVGNLQPKVNLFGELLHNNAARLLHLGDGADVLVLEFVEPRHCPLVVIVTHIFLLHLGVIVEAAAHPHLHIIMLKVPYGLSVQINQARDDGQHGSPVVAHVSADWVALEREHLDINGKSIEKLVDVLDIVADLVPAQVKHFYVLQCEHRVGLLFRIYSGFI